MLNIRMESAIYTNCSVQFREFQILMCQKKIYLDVFIYINGSKVYPGESSFTFHSKNVAIINAHDLRPIFNRSYISAKRVYIKVAPCDLTAFKE